MESSRVLTNRQIARAALVVLVGFLASGVLGIVRTAVISATLGASDAQDAFIAAQRIPEIVFVLVAGGALGSSFIPVFSRLREEQDDTGAWRLASAVMSISALAAALLGILVLIFAPWIVQTILRPGDSPDVQALTTALTRLMAITPVIFAVSGLLMGILHAHQRFLLPSIAISMNNVGLILGALVIAPLMTPDAGIAQVGRANVYGLAYGAILSALLHLAVQLPDLRRIQARLRPLLDWRVPGVREVVLLMGPRVLGLAVVQVNFVVNAAFTSSMVSGSLTVLTIAWTLMFSTLGVIAQSVGSAVFPSLAALAAANDLDGFKERLSGATRGVLFLAFPAMVGMIVLGQPAIAVIYQRGEWTAESTAGTAWALTFFALGIAGHSLLEVLSRAFYALSDTKTPVLVGTASMLSNIALSVILIRVMGEPGSLARGPFAGLALANSVTTLLEGLALWALLRRRIGSVGTIRGINDAYVLGGAWRALAAALGMGVAIWLVTNTLRDSGALTLTIAGGIVGGATFFMLALAFGLGEARAVPAMILQRARR